MNKSADQQSLLGSPDVPDAAGSLVLVHERMQHQQIFPSAFIIGVNVLLHKNAPAFALDDFLLYELQGGVNFAVQPIGGHYYHDINVAALQGAG